jgi:arginine repressor
LIQDLIDSGMTEVEITDALKEEGVHTTQATLNRIKTGAIKRTSYDIGTGIVRLHERIAPNAEM